MKKTFALALTAVFMLITVLSFSACKPIEKQIEGKYILYSIASSDGVFMDVGATIHGGPEYDCIVDKEMDFTQFYLEFKDGKMIEHGGITRFETSQGVKFKVDPDYVYECTFSLQKPERKNVAFYDIHLNGSEHSFYTFTPGGKYTSQNIAYSFTYYGDSKNFETRQYILEGDPKLTK